MTGPEHYREAEGLAQQAEGWLDADYGWKGQLSSEERLARRNGDLAAAQVHATLAHVAATADLFALYGQVGDVSKEAWRKAVTP